jgi:hypothetical protein
MKKINMYILGLIVFAVSTINNEAFAQESEFLIGENRDIQWGGFGAAEMKFSEVFGDYGSFIGFKAGVVMDNLVIGIAGEGLVSKEIFEASGISDELVDLTPTLAYGGLYSEYFIMREKPVHFSASALIGPGAAWIFEQSITETGLEDDDLIEFGGFLAIQPAINIELNVIDPVKFYVTAGYRIATSDDFDRLSSDDISGLTLGFGLKLGKY